MEDKNNYILAMNKVSAGEMLDQIKVSSYPHLKDKKAQDNLVNGLLTLSRFNKPKELTMAEIAQELGFS